MVNSGTTTICNGVDAPERRVWEGLRSLENAVGFSIGVGKICRQFESIISSSEEGVITLLPLPSVTPAIRIVGDGGDAGVMINDHGACRPDAVE